MATINEPSYTAACLLIISELIRCKEDLRFQLYSLEQISSQQKQRKIQSKDDDDEEEHFYDADKIESQPVQSGEVQGKTATYDPLKREPKYANAESSPIFELALLTFHTHPTVKLWATNLFQGQLINYNGDPLLDFGLANFLDRIAYKNPKSLDKVAAKFASSRRMAATETPINMVDFEKGEELHREEEEYMVKYFKARGPRQISQKKKDALEQNEESDEDPELEQYANDVIEKEMKKMNAGVDALDDEDELSDLEDLDEEGEDQSDFFDGEDDLQEVNMDDEQEEDSEDQMNVSGDDEIQEIDGGYGEEDDEEEEEDIFTKPSKGGKKEKPPKKSIFADYDEFAHLLEGDLYDGTKKSHHKHETGPRVGKPSKRPRRK